MIPDIILHKRGNNDNNIIVIEFKGWWSDVKSQKDDIYKLKELVDPYGKYKYQYGYSIILNNVEKGKGKYTITEVK